MIIHESINFEDVTVMMPELKVCFRGNDIHLSLTQLRLLMIFLSDPYGRFTSEELIRQMELFSKPHLNVVVTHLRKQLDQKYIFTVRGFGYAFALESHSQKEKSL
jgi:Response regulators consisting of a CheY-like receiver domain and a winged-helix DNA-binding domain